MPTRAKPKWGWEGRSPVQQDGSTLFSAEAVSSLADRYGISGDDERQYLKAFLEGAAGVYWSYKTHDELPRPNQVKAALTEINRLACELHDRLLHMDHLTRSYFWRPEMELMRQARDPEVSKSRFGHTFHRWQDDDGNPVVSWLDGKDLIEAVEVVGNFAKAAQDGLTIDKGGRRQSEALRMWVVNVRSYWTGRLGRKFSIDYHAGSPLTEAGSFCVDAFRLIDPSVPETRLVTTMRRVIRDMRSRAHRNPGEK